MTRRWAALQGFEYCLVPLLIVLVNSALLGKGRFGGVYDPGSCHVVDAGERSRARHNAVAHCPVES